MNELPKTMVHRLHEQAERLADRPALWSKRHGTWLPTSWREYARRVRHFALGLMGLGFPPGSCLGILSFNREEWVVAQLAAMASGGVAVGLYTTCSPEQLAYVLGHCEAPVVVVEGAAELARVQAVRAQLPALRRVVVMDPTAAHGEGVLSYAELLARGAAQDAAEYFQRVNALEPSGLGTLIYTSGTTGAPKGVMLSHHNLTWTAARLSQAVGLREDEVLLSYLPLSHIAEQALSVHGPIFNGLQVYFAQSFEALPEDLREVRPTVFFGVPRVWEKFKAKAQAGLEAQPRARRRVVAWARAVALRWHGQVLAGAEPGAGLELQYRLAQRLVFGPLKARLGLERTHLFATAAAPIGREVLDFFCSIDMVLREVYGQSEVTGPTSVNRPDATTLGSLGQPLPGVAVRIGEGGEILVQGENVCLGYFKDPQATAELLQGGWLHSGDLGELDARGYLRITGRLKEIIVTSGGKKTPPSTLEALLRALPPIGQALVVGDGRNHLAALLTLDPERAKAFATQQGFPTELEALPRHPGFRAWLNAQIDAEVNAKVSRFEWIRRVEVLATDFSVEGGELTPTLKVRRAAALKKYAAQIDALYTP